MSRNQVNGTFTTPPGQTLTSHTKVICEPWASPGRNIDCQNQSGKYATRDTTKYQTIWMSLRDVPRELEVN